MLEVLGLNTREILAAAVEKYSGVVDLFALLSAEPEPKGWYQELWKACTTLTVVPTMPT